MRESPKNICFGCKKKVKKLKAPFEGNYDKAIDVMFRPHFGSRWANPSTNANMTLIAVMCDDCYEEVVTLYRQKRVLRVKKPFL
tara:strand:+ start:3155 stop:3406 length:252 start_codon:yes stop_codon:yes gene_type:complete